MQLPFFVPPHRFEVIEGLLLHAHNIIGESIDCGPTFCNLNHFIRFSCFYQCTIFQLNKYALPCSLLNCGTYPAASSFCQLRCIFAVLKGAATASTGKFICDSLPDSSMFKCRGRILNIIDSVSVLSVNLEQDWEIIVDQSTPILAEYGRQLKFEAQNWHILCHR